MLKLEDIKKDAQVSGIKTGEIVRIVQVEAVGDAAITVYYKDSQSALSEQMLFRSDEARLDLAAEGKPWAFDAPGAEFKLGLEANRISQAALFDPKRSSRLRKTMQSAMPWLAPPHDIAHLHGERDVC